MVFCNILFMEVVTIHLPGSSFNRIGKIWQTPGDFETDHDVHMTYFGYSQFNLNILFGSYFNGVVRNTRLDI